MSPPSAGRRTAPVRPPPRVVQSAPRSSGRLVPQSVPSGARLSFVPVSQARWSASLPSQPDSHTDRLGLNPTPPLDRALLCRTPPQRQPYAAQETDPKMVNSHSYTLSSSTSPALKPSTGFFLSSASGRSGSARPLLPPRSARRDATHVGAGAAAGASRRTPFRSKLAGARYRLGCAGEARRGEEARRWWRMGDLRPSDAVRHQDQTPLPS